MTKQKIIDAWDRYVREHGEEPRFAECMIQWLDDQSVNIMTFALFEYNIDCDEDIENHVFYYARSKEDFLKLFEQNIEEDFIIVKLYCLTPNIVSHENDLCDYERPVWER